MKQPADAVQPSEFASENVAPVSHHDVKPAVVAPAKARQSLAHVRAGSMRALSTFYATFGALGVPMVVAFLLSSLTMLFMAVVQVVPTRVANWIMNTANLDDGEFWLLSVPPSAIVGVSTAMLALFSAAYFALAMSMVFFRHHLLRWAIKRYKATAPVASATVVQDRRAEKPRATRRSLLRDIMDQHGVYHAYYNALFDVPKLAFQTVAITTYLSEGFPLPLIQLYLVMLLASWLSSFYRFQDRSGDPHMIAARLFLLFDLFFSVFAPVIVLAYAFHQFQMDREAFAIRQETLSPGSYDLIARLFADPIQVDIFRFGFGHLQFTRSWLVITKLFLNSLGVYKCAKVIVLLVLHHAERAMTAKRPKMPEKPTEAKPEAPSKKQSFFYRAFRVHGKRRHLVFGVVVFLANIVAIATYVAVSITSSTHACAHIPECRVISYRWSDDDGDDVCPCIVYINRNEPRSFADWVNATDVTSSLADAAKSGHLKTVQVVNHAVPDLPEELRKCHEMEQLILVYSKTQSLPEWVGEFEGLHYIHVESDIIDYPLHTLPPTLFSNMPGLRFIRFGGASRLTAFPSLDGLHELTTLMLSLLHNLTELPSLDDLDALVTLFIADATHVTRLPSLEKLTKLRNFSLFRRNAMCCNGFITGTCDLSDFQCLARVDEPVVTCEASRLPASDRDKLDRIHGFVCSANMTTDVMDSEPTIESTDYVCHGLLYQQCRLGDRNGICSNGRMQIVHCDVYGEYEAMRRREIAQRVGGACTPQTEAWLGCKG